MSFDRFSDILQERFHVLFRRASKQEPVILPDILSQKVETVRDVCYLGFLLREFQSSLLEESNHEGFDFFFALLTASEEMDLRSVPAKNRLKAACL